MQATTRQFFASALSAALIGAAAGAALAQSPGYSPGQPGWYGRARPPAYAGDCKFPYPPGYRHDLKDWRTGQTDRDFSCYRIEND
ncbi:hypothetical protein IYX23_01935 [Methylocystis sp. L43]|jgi:hypothetical protein|uniref:hypothetical protein n=1 Tax=unclassified Methylocystis TaxID=2625913 RepID=UPI0018C2B511|nr:MULTISPECIES: hypothetical protein [unclassified Methylocystis]MBG0796458.1 hypothetical protein [Methylocystis sp. L43]MBG0804368.1 hypothetical protein [Methylocystis sp. H15]